MTEREQRFLINLRCQSCGQIPRLAKAYVGTEILCGCSEGDAAPVSERESTVTEAAVEAGRDAIRALDGCHGYETGAVCSDVNDENCACAIAARAALEAAAPLLVAGERANARGVILELDHELLVLGVTRPDRTEAWLAQHAENTDGT